MTAAKPPANFWAVMIALGSLALATVSMLMGTNKATVDDVRQNERRLTSIETSRAEKAEVNDLKTRLCRLEGIMDTGECKR